MHLRTVVCPKCHEGKGYVIKYGFFKRDTGHIPKIQRYLCKVCRFAFSAQTGSLTYRERKPHLTQSVMRSLMEGVSQRGCARLLGCRPITVARKLKRLGKRAKFHLESRATSQIANGSESVVIFDEMRTFEHTKCKPIFIALAVAESTREVIAVGAAEAPADGKLAKIARKRYGARPDNRSASMHKVLAEVHRLCPTVETLKSDKCTFYPGLVRKSFPKSVRHEVHKSRRAAVVGQGEMKRGANDPLFALNHTCAMFRDRIKRLARKTWCTTKKMVRLVHILNLYAWWHNKLVTDYQRPIHMD